MEDGVGGALHRRALRCDKREELARAFQVINRDDIEEATQQINSYISGLVEGGGRICPVSIQLDNIYPPHSPNFWSVDIKLLKSVFFRSDHASFTSSLLSSSPAIDRRREKSLNEDNRAGMASSLPPVSCHVVLRISIQSSQ